MLRLYRFKGLGEVCYLWLCGKKDFKLIKFVNGFLAPDENQLVTTKLNNYLSEFENSYILDSDLVPKMKMAIDFEFDKFFMKNLSILPKMVDAVEEIRVDTPLGTVNLSLIESNKLMSMTLGQMLNDGLHYRPISDEEKKSLELSVKISKLATLDSMKEKYDCSWVFNEDGSWKKDYKCITTMEELNWVKNELSKLPDKYYTGYDVETSGVNVFYLPDKKEEKSRLLGFSLSWLDNQGVYIPLESKVFECLDKDTVLKVLYSELIRLGIIAHNGQFEWKVMYDNGYTINITEDTMLLNFNIFPIVIKGFLTLKNLTRIWFGHETWEFSQLFGGKADPEMLVYLPKDILTIYGCADSDYARMLFFKLKEYLNKSQEFSYRLDCKIIELLGKGEYYGAMKDLSRIEKTEKILVSNLSKIESIMFKYILDLGLENRKEQIIMGLLEKMNVEPYCSLSDSERLEILNNAMPSDEEIKNSFIAEMENILTDKTFNSDPKLQKILYSILDYPILTYKRRTKKAKQKEKERIAEARALGQIVKPKPPSPATDESALVNLLKYRLETPNEYFKDIVGEDDSVVISGEELNSYKYPFAKLLLEYKDINKQLTTFYKQHHENPSRYWYNENKQCQAVTSRLISSAQLVDKRTKNIIIPYTNCYGINADYSQIEIRNMAGCSNRYWNAMEKLINKDELSIYHRNGLKDYIITLNNPETDIHRETASGMLRKPVEDVTDDERGGHKKYGFGIPYGMLGFALSANDIAEYVDRMSDNPDEQLNRIVMDNGIGVSKWNFANYPIYRYLQYNRENILIEREDKPEDRIPPYFEGHKIGYVENDYGRRRYFYLDDLTESMKHNIFKEGGNYPIQSGSREIFFVNKLNMYNDMKKLGLVTNPCDGSSPVPDKFFMSIFVHDEFFGSVNVEVHPFDILKLVYKNCFINIKYHPTYFMGINFVNNWYEGKKGKYELPVYLVKEIYEVPKEEYPEYKEGYFIIRDNENKEINRLWVIDYFAQLIKNYEVRRVIEEVNKFTANKNEDFDWESITRKITSYTVRPLIVKYGLTFGCTKKDSMSTMLKTVWENRNHDFLVDKVKCTRIEEVDETTEDRDIMSEDEFDFFDNLFDENAEEFVDEEVFNAMNLNRLVVKTKEQSFDKFRNESVAETSGLNSYSVKPRKEYESRNMYKEEIDPRVIIPISGKLILNFNQVKFENQRKILEDIRNKFKDENGSVVEVMNALGINRQDFRIFNFTRKDIEEIMSKYD